MLTGVNAALEERFNNFFAQISPESLIRQESEREVKLSRLPVEEISSEYGTSSKTNSKIMPNDHFFHYCFLSDLFCFVHYSLFCCQWVVSNTH